MAGKATGRRHATIQYLGKSGQFCSMVAHHREKCNCPWPLKDTHPPTHTNVHTHSMINSTICSLGSVLMLSGQSINSLMGMLFAAPLTLVDVVLLE